MSQHKQPSDYQRRFSGLQRLYGSTFSLANAHVLIIGLGGVGSWAAEALARSGIGELTLCDLDHIATSNINRQVHALSSTLGASKIQAMADRIQEIQPNCTVHLFDDFVNAENITSLLQEHRPDYVLDACDQTSAKLAIILACKNMGIPCLSCGSAGGKQNPLTLRQSDLSMVHYDKLLGRLRNLLRQEHGYPKGSDTRGKALKSPPKMGVLCLWFEEESVKPKQTDSCSLQGLSCAGYGSCVTITASMGLLAANTIIKQLA